MDRGREEESLSSLSNPSQAVADNRTQKLTFEKHICNLPGNIRDRGDMIKVIYLKRECKRKMVGREPLKFFPGCYDINSAT